MNPVESRTTTPVDGTGGATSRYSLRHELLSRLRGGWKIKLVATPVLVTAFFVGYFLVLKRPLFAVTTMPLTALDRAIGFFPAALPLYLSLWVYVFLVLILLRERAELLLYGQAVIGLAVIGLAIFVAWPTAVPPADIAWEEYPAFLSLKAVDATGNACPSLHVAFAVFSAVWLHRVLRQMGDRGFFRATSWVWCLGIVYSTLATKQHVAWDVLAGALLGVAAARLGHWRVDREHRRL